MTPWMGIGLLSLAVAVGVAGRAAASHESGWTPDGKMFVYIGTYTQRGSEGIYRCRLDTATGELSQPELAAKTPNPTFLAIDPSHEHLYAANEIGNYQGKRS